MKTGIQSDKLIMKVTFVRKLTNITRRKVKTAVKKSVTYVNGNVIDSIKEGAQCPFFNFPLQKEKRGLMAPSLSIIILNLTSI